MYMEKNKILFQQLDTTIKKGVLEQPVNSFVLLKVLQIACSDAELVKKVTCLRDIEENARNTAAHEIVSVTDEWLQKRVGYNSKQIMKLLKEFTQQACSGIRTELWNSYDDMNQLLIQTLTRK